MSTAPARDPRPFKIHRDGQGSPRWYQRWLETWWIITGQWTLHRAWQAGCDHGAAREYVRIVVRGGELSPIHLKAFAWDQIEELRGPEGHAVTIVCDNPDFNDQPNSAVDCCGDWTGWRPKRFTGDTVMEALASAHRAMRARKIGAG